MASTGEAVFADGVDERHETRYDGISDHGHYCIPMLAEKELVGVLNLYLKPKHRRDVQEEQFLRSVGMLIAGAVKYRQMAEELRLDEERFALAVRGTDAGIWDWDLRTNHMYFSPRWKSMIGYAENEIKDQFSEWELRLHPEDRDRALGTVRDYLAGKLPEFELEHRLRHKDGSYRWILARGAVVRDAAGNPYRMAGSHLDITERKRLERTLVEKEAELLAAAEIQACLLPHSPPEIPGFEVAGRCFPAELAAGDHFDFHLSSDGSHVLVLGDVSGHGVGPAILTACFHARFLALAESTSDLLKIAGVLNSRLYRDTAGELFITMIAGRIDPAERTLCCVNAGHPAGIVLNAAGDVKARFESTSLPLAILPEVAFHTSERVFLEDGDIVFFFTDGLSEARRAGQSMFGIDRAVQVICGIGKRPRLKSSKPCTRLYERILRARSRTMTSPLSW